MATNAHLLIVEDNASLQKFFLRALVPEGYRVDTVRSSEEALTSLAKTPPDLIVSDVVLKGKDGVWLCREVHGRAETAHIPVILMSGHRIEETDQIEGLGAGADDYLLKPFSTQILLAKINSVLRRYQAPKELAEILKAHGLTLDVQARVASLRSHHISLTRKEFDLLTAFLRQPGKILSIAFLLEGIWGIDPQLELDTHTVKVHVSSLRNKLGPALGERIVSVPREGYRFVN